MKITACTATNSVMTNYSDKDCTIGASSSPFPMVCSDYNPYFYKWTASLHTVTIEPTICKSSSILAINAATAAFLISLY